MLIKYPNATTTILKGLSELCTASIALTLTTIRGVMVGQLQHLVPQIFLEPSKDGTLFWCSESFVQKFLKRSLGWSLRRSTRAGGKTPEKAPEILKKAFLWMAYTIKDEEIPSALIVNSDQTQVTLTQGCHMTYAPIGSRQVVTTGSEEKQAITVMVSSSNNSTLLPFQAIYKGSTQTSLPSRPMSASNAYSNNQCEGLPMRMLLMKCWRSSQMGRPLKRLASIVSWESSMTEQSIGCGTHTMT